jgi:endonuclease/exonuclease/phosphatase family metal-dependent hydrolase
MLALSWNLFHGRSQPPAGRPLLGEFEAKLSAWEWDVALLQEVPPWWPAPLARAAGAEQRTAMTSRNSLLALRRALAERRPDLIKSNGGGCNAVLSRVPIAGHRNLRLRLWPERRVAQLLRLTDGTCVANFHASVRVPLAEQELARLIREAEAWAQGRPLVLGGDLNLRRPHAPGKAFEHVAARDVDHLFARGMATHSEAELLDRQVIRGDERFQLSDHPPLRVRFDGG